MTWIPLDDLLQYDTLNTKHGGSYENYTQQGRAESQPERFWQG